MQISKENSVIIIIIFNLDKLTPNKKTPKLDMRTHCAAVTVNNIAQKIVVIIIVKKKEKNRISKNIIFM